MSIKKLLKMHIEAKNINLKTVEICDAEFIYKLRKDKSKTKFLSSVNGTINDQINYISKYKEKEKEKKEFYFIIESKAGEKLGLVRMYDFVENSFCWGSWLIKKGAPISTSIESVLQIYEFGFYQLGFEKSHFMVSKGNEKVASFHKRFGAKIIKEDNIEYFFDYTIEEYEKIKKKYIRYLR